MHSASRHITPIPGVHVITMTSDRSFPRHSHDEFGFGLMLSRGHDTWSGRGAVEAVAGDIITVNPAEMHDGLGRAGEPRAWRMIYLSPEALRGMVDPDPDRLEFHLPVLSGARTTQLAAAALEKAECADATPSELEQCLLVALGSLLTEAGAKPEVGRAPLAVARVVERIQSEWHEPLSLDDFAATAGLSKFQILRAFSRELGITPHAYLIQHRLNRARAAVMEGVELAEAAVASGFADQAHLTRAFKRQFGLSPGRYVKAGGGPQ